MRVINIKDIDLNESFFHFTNKENLANIEKKGLKAKRGDASEMVGDTARVCFSKGAKGLMGIKNSFLYEFKKLRICDIPFSYRRYFSISDFSSEAKLKVDQIYEAMFLKFQEEVYLKVDAVLGSDYVEEETYGLSSEYDIKGLENHDVSPEKLSLVVTDTGYSAFDVIQYIFERMKNVFPEDLLKDFLGDLCDFFDYIDEYKETIQK